MNSKLITGFAVVSIRFIHFDFQFKLYAKPNVICFKSIKFDAKNTIS